MLAASQFCCKWAGLCDMGMVITHGCCTSQARAIWYGVASCAQNLLRNIVPAVGSYFGILTLS